MKKNRLTKSGFDSLKKEFEELNKIKKPYAVERLHKARSMGDLSENSEYTAAKEELAFVEGRILEIETILNDVEIIGNSGNGNKIEMGTSVTVDIGGKREQFQIVGEFEADPACRKLSHTSPIGSALLGKKAGETVEINVPAGKLTYRIVEIR